MVKTAFFDLKFKDLHQILQSSSIVICLSVKLSISYHFKITEDVPLSLSFKLRFEELLSPNPCDLTSKFIVLTFLIELGQCQEPTTIEEQLQYTFYTDYVNNIHIELMAITVLQL